MSRSKKVVEKCTSSDDEDDDDDGSEAGAKSTPDPQHPTGRRGGTGGRGGGAVEGSGGKIFSGKMKKEQLQEKRRRKAEKEADKDDATTQSKHPHQAVDTATKLLSADKTGVRSEFAVEERAMIARRREEATRPMDLRRGNPAIPPVLWFSYGSEAETKLRLPPSSAQIAKTPADRIPSVFTLVSTFPVNPQVPIPLSLSLPCTAGDEGSDEVALPTQRRGAGKPAAARPRHQDPADTSPWDESHRTPFRSWLALVDALPPSPHHVINFFERNVQVWQQLWNVVQHCDVAVAIADIRFAVYHLPLSLFYYLMIVEAKPVVVVFNKCDLVPASVVADYVAYVEGPIARQVKRWWLAAKETGRSARQRSSEPPALRAVTFCAAPDEFKTLGAGTSAPEGGGGDASQRRKRKKAHEKTKNNFRDGNVGAGLAAELALLQKRGSGAVPTGPPKRGARGHHEDDDDPPRDPKGPRPVVTKRPERKCGSQDVHQAGNSSHGETDSEESSTDASTSGEGSSGDDAKAAAGAKELLYGSTERFAGMAKAQRDLVKDRVCQDAARAAMYARVGKSIDELLLACRDCSRGRRLKEEDAPPSSSTHPTTSSAAMLRVALTGHPNVGKSSLINIVKGTKVVSVSATPGHTKHAQTIILPDDKVTFFDCPGVSFPQYGVPRPLQSVLGTIQIAQTPDPQSGVAYVATHVDIEKVYGLRKAPDSDERDPRWSAYDICESYAIKRGYFAKGKRGTADIHRAAIAILQEAFGGSLVFYFCPPKFVSLQDETYTMESSFASVAPE